MEGLSDTLGEPAASLVHEPKVTMEALSEISFLSSYCLQPLEPPTTWTAISRGMGGCLCGRHLSWQVVMSAERPAIAVEKKEADRETLPAREGLEQALVRDTRRPL